MKNRFEPSNIYSFSCRIRIRIQNWTKTSPRNDFDRFFKNPEFYKNPIVIDFYKGGGIGRRPFLIFLISRGDHGAGDMAGWTTGSQNLNANLGVGAWGL